MVIDEASQSTEPSSLIPLVSLVLISNLGRSPLNYPILFIALLACFCVKIAESLSMIPLEAAHIMCDAIWQSTKLLGDWSETA